MSRPLAYSFASLSLLTVIACAPKSPEDSATDTDETSESSGASDSDSSTGEPTTGEPDSSTGEPSEACVAPDPAAKASVSLDLGEWPLVPDAYPEQIRAAADCTVQSATSVAGDIAIALLCSEGELVDMPVGLHVTGPADFGVDFVKDDKVKLDAYWQADGHHIISGHWFALHDTNGELLLAGLDYDSAGAPQDALAPLTVLTLDSVCEPACESGGVDCDLEWDGVERLAVGFAHKDGPSVDVIDESRAQLISNGRRYDIVVAQAEHWYCLNCGSLHTWIVRQADQE
jgi:hypothetical protein